VISGYFPRARGTSPHWFGQSWQSREVVGDEAEGEDRLDLGKAARFGRLRFCSSRRFPRSVCDKSC
jgi:hypothetical protein